jgi:hypothetical protein
MALRTAQAVPPDTRYVGIRAHEIEIVNTPDGYPNAAPVTLAIQIDNLLSMVLIVNVHGQSTPHCEMAKPAWQAIAGGRLYVTVPEDKILFLR